MKKLIFTIGLGLLFTSNVTFSQRSCAAMDHHQSLVEQNPQIQFNLDQINQFTEQFIANGGGVTNKVAVNIPVVVHVLYNNTTQNISDAQINSQIAVLNADFKKQNTDWSNTPSVFQSLVADCELTFCLASVSPTGAATTGIVRKSVTKTVFDANTDDAKYNSTGGADAWPAGSYLNIWVVPSIKAGTNTGILGYAQFPGGPAATDGLVICYNYFGTTGAVSAPYNKGRTATHEIGHWLNLYHIWGDDGTACTGSDQCSDTPNQADENYGTPSFPQVSCSNSGDMHMNYMDYVDDAAMYMFTTGQKARMQALFTTGGSRASLLTSNGCGSGTPPTPAYCTSNATNVSYEWISNVSVGTINNTTAANGGYGNFTNLSTNLTIGSATPISLSPGFASSAYTEYFAVYIDYNKDLDFADAGELVYSGSGTAAVSGSFTVPSGTATGSTRMRVIMKDAAITSSCGTYTYGEVEDYTVNIVAAASTCNAPASLTTSALTSSGATLSWGAVSGASNYTVQVKTSASSTWTSYTATTNSLALTGLTASTIYNWQVRTNCTSGSSAYTAGTNFTTSAATATCNAPATLATSAITSTGATLTWGAVTGASNYTVQVKTSTATTWTSYTATSNTLSVTGLTASTIYNWQVRTNCTSGSSAYVAGTNFTTAAATVTCNAPTGLATSAITSTGATVSWAAISGASSYTLQVKTSTATTWTSYTVTSNSRILTGLTASTIYNWRVRTNCTSGSSAYTTGTNFTTLAASSACTDAYESNNTLSTAKAPTVNTNLTGLISTTTDQDWYKVTTTSTLKNIQFSLTNLPGDYDLYLYNSAGALLASSENGSTTSEIIKYNNAAVATYYFLVKGYNSAYSATSCYTFNIGRSSVAFKQIENNEEEISVSKVDETVFTIMPNPSVDGKFVFNLTNEIVGEVALNVFDQSGRLVVSEKLNKEDNFLKSSIDLSDKNRGIYIVKISSDTFQITERVIFGQ